MSWKYAKLKIQDTFSVVEVYFKDDPMCPNMFGEATVMSETTKGLLDVLKMMKNDLKYYGKVYFEMEDGKLVRKEEMK